MYYIRDYSCYNHIDILELIMIDLIRNKTLFFIYYVLSTALLVYLSLENSKDPFNMQIFSTVFMILIGNFILSTILYILKENIFAIFEISKTKKAYLNARNRVQFFKNNEIVCLEGTIEAQDKNNFVYSPITKQRTVAYTYGNNLVAGGAQQIPATINPSGESIPMNGLLSITYFPENTYNPKTHNLSHFYNYILQEKSNSLQASDISSEYLLQSFNKLNSFSTHNKVVNFSQELFLNNTYNERYIPYGIYGWVVGKWSKNKELLPLKFSGCIFAIEKDYRNNFYGYISKMSKEYLRNTIILAIIVLFILTIIIFTTVFNKIF